MAILQALVAFAGVAALLTIMPGVDTALTLRAGLADGARAGIVTGLGISCGVLVWGVAGALGISALLRYAATALTAIRLAGAAYLLWLAVKFLRSALRGSATPAVAAGAERAPAATPWTHWRRGFLCNILNPKVGVFYLAVLPQFLVPGVPPAAMGVWLALVHAAEGFVWTLFLVGFTGLAGRWLRSPVAQRTVDGVTGGVLGAFGVAVAAEALR
ncbi:MAG: LysE family translocator [Pseudoclavibacter sp.]